MSQLFKVFAAREKNFEWYLQAEGEMTKYCFTFDHINYSRYLIYQHVYLRTLQNEQSKAVADLDEQGFGGPHSSLPFKSLDGHLITEIFNGQTKRQAGPHAAGFSTDINKVKDWVRTAHIHAKLRYIFTEKTKLQTNSCHKECTPGARKFHVSNMKALKQQLRICRSDPSVDLNARDITTGEELPKDIIENLLNPDSIGNEKYLSFVTERLVKGIKGFFEPVAKLQIALGIKNKNKTSKAISVTKEDSHAFGVILGKDIDLNEALKYPITSTPLSIGNPDGTLLQSRKNTFRNFLIDQSSALETQPTFQSRWIIDTMAIMRGVKSKKTYKKWFTALKKIVTPNEHCNPEYNEFVYDTCRSISSKSCMRTERRESGKRVYLHSECLCFCLCILYFDLA